MAGSATPAASTTSRLLASAAAVIAALCLLAGLFAVTLNKRFYERNQPFYDSMAYHAHVYRVMVRADSDGLLPALGDACHSSTVCLPLALAASVGLIFEPSRTVGIAIQSIGLAAFALTLLYYLVRIRRMWPTSAVIATLPFLLWRCLYEPNGGLSDFRMDLGLALLFATTALWYLTAVSTGSIPHYVLLGVSAAAACLSRATAPIYLIIALAPLVCVDLVAKPTPLRQIRGLVIASTIAIGGCGWFYLINYDRLHYYYLVWNTDANARLPLKHGLMHAWLAVCHIGIPAVVLAVTFSALHLVDGLRLRHSLGVHLLRLLDWRIAWVGLAPIALLVVRGAGLNPFVSMPAAFGLTLLLVLPMSGFNRYRPSWAALAALGLVAFCCAGAATSRGWHEHFGGGIDSMESHREALRQIVADVRRMGRSKATYSTMHCFHFQPASIESVALFDMQSPPSTGRSCTVDGVGLRSVRGMAIAAEADWAAVPGDTPESKLVWLLATVQRTVDYLAIPDEGTCQFVERHTRHNVINRYATVIRERLLQSGVWEPINACIRNGEHEVVQIYRNTTRIGSSLMP